MFYNPRLPTVQLRFPANCHTPSERVGMGMWREGGRGRQGGGVERWRGWRGLGGGDGEVRMCGRRRVKKQKL